MSKSIVACLMVRNESKVVVRMLESLKNVVSGISLTDTGSVDNTIELAEKWAEENNIRLVTTRNVWINFGVNRTMSAINSRKNFPEADYHLLIDGDMVLLPQADFDVSSLTVDDYSIPQLNGPLEYYNTRLFSGKKFYRSIAGTHEYWGCPITVKSSKTASLKLDDLNDGGCREDKHPRDKKIMLEGLRRNVTPDYLVGRYNFYLAQAYQGLGDLSQSIKWYKKCVTSCTWDQEIYYSKYQIAENHYRAKNYQKSLYYSLNAFDYRQSRAEPLVIATRCCMKLGMERMAKTFSDMGRKIPKSADSLFVNVGAYDGTLFDEALKVTK